MGYLGYLNSYYEVLFEPIVDAYYTENKELAEELFASASKKIYQFPELDEDAVRALEYEVIVWRLHLNNQFRSLATDDELHSFKQHIHGLEPAGEQSEIAQAFHMISLYGMGARRHVFDVDSQEIWKYLDKLPDSARQPVLWYYIAVWAYFYNDEELIKLALAEQTIHSTGWQDEYYWLRTNMMHLIVTDRVTKDDVYELLRRYEHPTHITDFRKLFLERLEEIGLIDDQILEYLEIREKGLAEFDKTVPKYSPSTKKIRNE